MFSPRVVGHKTLFFLQVSFQGIFLADMFLDKRLGKAGWLIYGAVSQLGVIMLCRTVEQQRIQTVRTDRWHIKMTLFVRKQTKGVSEVGCSETWIKM